MKIAILSLYNGTINRGVETWTVNFASRLHRKGRTIKVFQTRDQNVPYKVEIINLHIDFSKRAYNKNSYLNLLNLIYLSLINFTFTIKSLPSLVNFHPDIVIPNNGGIQSFVIRILSFLFNWKMIVIGHAGIGRPDKINLLIQMENFDV